MYCSIRGIQQIVHYLSAAITVFKEGSFDQDLQRTMAITQRLASISPSTEVVGQQQINTKSKSTPLVVDHQQSNLLAKVKKENKRTGATEKSVKRKSLHLPANTTMTSQEDIVEQLNLQQQPLTNFDNNTNRSAMSFSFQPSPNQPNQQQQQIINHNTTHFNQQPYNTSNNNMSIDPNLSNLPNHQSLLGLLLYNEDEGDTNNNIPT
jgi:hypothetical protein